MIKIWISVHTELCGQASLDNNSIVFIIHILVRPVCVLPSIFYSLQCLQSIVRAWRQPSRIPFSLPSGAHTLAICTIPATPLAIPALAHRMTTLPRPFHPRLHPPDSPRQQFRSPSTSTPRPFHHPLRPFHRLLLRSR